MLNLDIKMNIAIFYYIFQVEALEMYVLNGHWWHTLQNRLGYIKILVLIKKKRKKVKKSIY